MSEAFYNFPEYSVVLFRIYYFLRLFDPWLSTIKSWDVISSPADLYIFPPPFCELFHFVLKSGDFF